MSRVAFVSIIILGAMLLVPHPPSYLLGVAIGACATLAFLE